MFDNDPFSNLKVYLKPLLQSPIFICKLLLFVVGLVAIGVGAWLGLGGANQVEAAQNCPVVESTSGDLSETDELMTLINVDVGGAVAKPGLYELKKGSRYADLISIAGGLAREVSKEFVAKDLNLSKELKDQEKVYLPFEGELGMANTDKKEGSTLVSINTAGSETLQMLKGIGEATAQKIISGRPYSELNQLIANKILGEKLFNDLQNQLTL